MKIPLTPLNIDIYYRKKEGCPVEYFARQVDDLGGNYFVKVQVRSASVTEDNVKTHKLVLGALEDAFIYRCLV